MSIRATQSQSSQSSRCSGCGASRIGCGTVDHEIDAMSPAPIAITSVLQR